MHESQNVMGADSQNSLLYPTKGCCKNCERMKQMSNPPFLGVFREVFKLRFNSKMVDKTFVSCVHHFWASIKWNLKNCIFSIAFESISPCTDQKITIIAGCHNFPGKIPIPFEMTWVGYNSIIWEPP